MEIRGDLEVKRTLIADRRADQGLFYDAAVITTVTLTRHSQAWQYLVAAAAQNVVMPDASTLPLGWRVVVQAGTSALTVKDSASGTLKVVAPNKAYEFIYTTVATTVGVWYVNALEEASAITIVAYTDTFDATTDWGSPSAGYYTITVAGATHGISGQLHYQIYSTADAGTTYDAVDVDKVTVTSASNDLAFRVPEVPDLRFAGQYVLIG